MKLYIVFILISLGIFLGGCGLTPSQIKDRDAYLYRAHVYFANKKYPNALQQITLALDIDPECKRALISKGWTLYYLGKLDDAHISFKRAYEADNSDPWVQHGLGSVCFKYGARAGEKHAKLVRYLQQKPDKKKKYQADVLRYKKEKDLWLAKSLKHYKNSLSITPENYELHKLISYVYAAQGFDTYSLAISHIDKYIKLVSEERKGLELLLKKKKKERLKPDISQKDKKYIDIVIVTLEKQIKKNKAKLITVQETAGNLSYQLATLERARAKESSDKAEKEDHMKRMIAHATDAANRVKMIITLSPASADHYRNLANISKLLGKYAESAKYLQEYLKRYPLAPAKDRVNAKMEIEKLKKRKEL